jgi:hypothetical protein
MKKFGSGQLVEVASSMAFSTAAGLSFVADVATATVVVGASFVSIGGSIGQVLLRVAKIQCFRSAFSTIAPTTASFQ